MKHDPGGSQGVNQTKEVLITDPGCARRGRQERQTRRLPLPVKINLAEGRNLPPNPNQNTTPEGPREEVWSQMGQTKVPSCIPVGKAGVSNPGADTPCKNQPYPARKGGNLPPALTETQPRRVPGRISDQRGSDYQPWLRIDEGGRRDKPGGCRSL